MGHDLQVSLDCAGDGEADVLRIGGCLTPETFPSLWGALVARLDAVGTAPFNLDLRGAQHVDPRVLLRLRRFCECAGGEPSPSRSRIELWEPIELPVCSFHGAPGLPAFPAAEVPHSRSCLTSGRAGEERGPILGLNLCEFYDGALDPEATVRTMPLDALSDLADGLYRHLDAPVNSIQAQLWFELAANEVHRRTRETRGRGRGGR